MEVYKFGGASVKDALAVKNVVSILSKQQGQRKVVVFSAMGKTTNMLEMVHAQRTSLDNWKPAFDEVVDFHHQVASDLGIQSGEMFEDFLQEVKMLEMWLKQPAPSNEHLDYDKIVASGELMSTLLIAAYLEQEGFNCEWMDVRNVIKTNSEHRAADVDWLRSKRSAEVLLAHLEEDPTRMVITQGFISQSKLGNTTTLGREGSDFSAAIIAHLLEAKSVTIWKDVPGMLNADPKWFSNTIEIPHISYSEVIELSYYGASVIHPKTIQPLQQKGIPLYVKSFNNPEHRGTVIDETTDYDALIPMYVFKPDQVLLSVRSRDLSFVVEKHLSDIFEMAAATGLHVNVMQNSAVSFSMCVDQDERRIKQLRELLKANYEVYYNEGLELLTMRHYDDSIIKKLTKDKEVLVEQRSRQTLRLVLR